MINKNLIELFITNKLRFLGCNQPNIAIFFKPESSDTVKICVVSDHTGKQAYSPSALSSLSKELERKFVFNGYKKISQHYLLYTNDVTREKTFADSDLSFWICDVKDQKLIIYENAPDNFCGLKDGIEKLLYAPEVSSFSKKKTSLKTLPIISFLLIGINIFLFILIEILGSTTDANCMLKFGALSWRHVFLNNEYIRLFSCMFLHFGLNHLMNNMISLGVLGHAIENHIGHFRFTVIYLISGIGSSIFSALYNMKVHYDEYVISAGASGAIYGLFGCLLILSLVYPDVRKSIRPANIALVVFLSIVNSMYTPDIDNTAHISGFLVGVIITFISCLCHKNVIK